MDDAQIPTVTPSQTTVPVAPPAAPAQPVAQIAEAPIATAQSLPQEPPAVQVNPSVLASAAIAQTAQAVPQDPMSVPGKTKEVAPPSAEPLGSIEVVGTDAIEKEPLPPEVSGWMEKVKRGEAGEQKPPEVVVADISAQAPTDNYASQPVFVLPLGKTEMRQGIHKSVNDSVRWLSEWCGRLMKKFGNKVALADE